MLRRISHVPLLRRKIALFGPKFDHSVLGTRVLRAFVASCLLAGYSSVHVSDNGHSALLVTLRDGIWVWYRGRYGNAPAISDTLPPLDPSAPPPQFGAPGEWCRIHGDVLQWPDE